MRGGIASHTCVGSPLPPSKVAAKAICRPACGRSLRAKTWLWGWGAGVCCESASGCSSLHQHLRPQHHHHVEEDARVLPRGKKHFKWRSPPARIAGLQDHHACPACSALQGRADRKTAPTGKLQQVNKTGVWGGPVSFGRLQPSAPRLGKGRLGTGDPGSDASYTDFVALRRPMKRRSERLDKTRSRKAARTCLKCLKLNCRAVGLEQSCQALASVNSIIQKFGELRITTRRGYRAQRFTSTTLSSGDSSVCMAGHTFFAIYCHLWAAMHHRAYNSHS